VSEGPDAALASTAARTLSECVGRVPDCRVDVPASAAMEHAGSARSLAGTLPIVARR